MWSPTAADRSAVGFWHCLSTFTLHDQGKAPALPSAAVSQHTTLTAFLRVCLRCAAIHRAAGPKLLAACQQVPEVAPDVRCPTGEARMTT